MKKKGISNKDTHNTEKWRVGNEVLGKDYDSLIDAFVKEKKEDVSEKGEKGKAEKRERKGIIVGLFPESNQGHLYPKQVFYH